MWVNIKDEPIPTYKNHNKVFLLNLQYSKYFGHGNNKDGEVVTAVWGSINECFYETETNIAIDDRDIIQWYKEI